MSWYMVAQQNRLAESVKPHEHTRRNSLYLTNIRQFRIVSRKGITTIEI